MRATITFRPKTLTAPRKIDAISILYNRYGYDFRGWAWPSPTERQPISANLTKDKTKVVLYNLQKVRRKVKYEMVLVHPNGRIAKRKTANTTLAKSKVVVRENHWIVNIYEIPVELVKTAHQKTRNFTVVLKDMV